MSEAAGYCNELGIALTAVFAVGVVAFLVACWRDGEDGLGINPDSPRASDGSSFWGRKQAEATQGKVVTKESGGSREQAKEALAAAEKEAPRKGQDRNLAYMLEREDRYRDERDSARAEADQLRGALTECRRELAEARAAQAVPAVCLSPTEELLRRMNPMDCSPGQWIVSTGGTLFPGSVTVTGGTVFGPPMDFGIGGPPRTDGTAS